MGAFVEWWRLPAGERPVLHLNSILKGAPTHGTYISSEQNRETQLTADRPTFHHPRSALIKAPFRLHQARLPTRSPLPPREVIPVFHAASTFPFPKVPLGNARWAAVSAWTDDNQGLGDGKVPQLELGNQGKVEIGNQGRLGTGALTPRSGIPGGRFSKNRAKPSEILGVG